jgi:hypothetical protein
MSTQLDGGLRIYASPTLSWKLLSHAFRSDAEATGTTAAKIVIKAAATKGHRPMRYI